MSTAERTTETAALTVYVVLAADVDAPRATQSSSLSTQAPANPVSDPQITEGAGHSEANRGTGVTKSAGKGVGASGSTPGPASIGVNPPRRGSITPRAGFKGSLMTPPPGNKGSLMMPPGNKGSFTTPPGSKGSFTTPPGVKGSSITGAAIVPGAKSSPPTPSKPGAGGNVIVVSSAIFKK